NTFSASRTLPFSTPLLASCAAASASGTSCSRAAARMVGEKVEQLQRQKNPIGQMAILVRTSAQTRAFEERMITLGIPYRVVGGLRFYERQEIRDAIAYMRVLAQPQDDLAFERIINLPRRGVGDVALRTMRAAAREQEVPLALAAAQLASNGVLKGKVRDALNVFFTDLARWRRGLEGDGHVVTVSTMLDESGYTGMWQADKSPDAPGRLDNLKELVRALADFETLGTFLEHVSLVMENDANAEGERISMMTLHGAKGLEFDTVFLPGWEEGLFPSQRTLDEGGLKGLEEERRLAYVGLTRARKRAIVSFAANRRLYANWQSSIPSRFIEEMPEEWIERAGTGTAQRREMMAAPSVFLSGPLVARRNAEVSRGGEALPWEPPVRPKQTTKIAVGARVFHQKFGYGEVLGVEDDRLDVLFEKAGQKRLLDRFVEVAS
ncbi:MAG: DNA helicase II, partial [Alphaproteobacteria bacterium]